MRIEWRPVHGLVACAARPCGVSTAMTETGLMTDEHFARAEQVAIGHRVGGWVIHFPAGVCTNSPNIIDSIWPGVDDCGVRPSHGARTTASGILVLI